MKTVNLSLSEFVEKFVLAESVNHAPTLFSEFSYLIKNWNVAIIAHKQPYKRHRNEGASSPNACTAVDHWDSVIFDCI